MEYLGQENNKKQKSSRIPVSNHSQGYRARDLAQDTGAGQVQLLRSSRPHPEFEDHIAWLKGHAKNYHPYDPERFDPKKVHFDNPKQRWRIAFSQAGNE